MSAFDPGPAASPYRVPPAHRGSLSAAADPAPLAPLPGWAAVTWDLIVVGGGNAAVSSAIAADDSGARVLILERAPQYMRGGNTRHTRNIRFVHKRDEFNSGDYSFEELWTDLCNVGTGPNDEDLARFTVRASETLPGWMYAHGARWQRPLSGTLQLGRTNRFFLGGGKALLNSYYRYLGTRRNVSIAYEVKVDEFEFTGARCDALLVELADGRRVRVATRAVVCACGGFEANLDWLRRYWADAVDNYIIRGTPFNDGHILARLYDDGAASAGEEKGFHAIALDARAPKFDGGIATRLDTIPFGIAVNKLGQRFYDEGEDIWPKRYAIWGRNIADQPDQIVYSLWDSKVNRLFLPPMYGVTAANDIGDLAAALGLDREAVTRTVSEYNSAVAPGRFDPDALDDCRTAGLKPPKSHWAQRLDQPPYYGIAMRPGITFTYMGVAVDQDARVRRTDDSTFENVFAAGEIMSGNILTTGYLAGFGMTIGAVWGRHAGQKAVEHVRK
jgi:tricarballylate dehydrogenase